MIEIIQEVIRRTEASVNNDGYEEHSRYAWIEIFSDDRWVLRVSNVGFDEVYAEGEDLSELSAYLESLRK